MQRVSKGRAAPAQEVDTEAPVLTPLYKGDVQVKFLPKSHQYWVSIDGERAARKTGVTTFIGIKDKSRPLGSWQQQITADFLLKAIQAGKKINVDLALEACVQNDVQREEAADIGKEIHAWCEHYIKRQLKVPGYKDLPALPDFPEAVTGTNAFMSWLDEHKVKFLSTERAVLSRKHDYIGTMDLEAVIDGFHCKGDFKSSNGLYNGVRMQTAAYAVADTEERGKAFKGYQGRWAVRLNKYTEAEYMRRETRKKELRRAIARIKGADAPKEYPIKPYQIFEAVFLDTDPGSMKRDFAAFINCMELTRWDRATDAFYNGGSL